MIRKRTQPKRRSRRKAAEKNPVRLLVPRTRRANDLRLGYSATGAPVPGYRFPSSRSDRAYAAAAALKQRRAGRQFARMMADLAGARDRLGRAGG